MSGKDESYCNACIGALLLANTSLAQEGISRLLEKREFYGKPDTLGLDAIPEIQIGNSILDFDPSSAMITEELGKNFLANWPIFADISFHPSVFFCDPTDRSDNLAGFLKAMEAEHGNEKFGQVVARKEAIEKWEATSQSPVSITGATGAITCVRKGRIIFSVIINYISQQLVVACPSGITIVKLDDNDTAKGRKFGLAEVQKRGTAVEFNPVSPESPWEHFKYYTAFRGSVRKTGYNENLIASEIMPAEDCETFVRHRAPGGPARILYLSALQPADQPMGFILANGEKITEWIHWLPFAMFARRGNERMLRVFEISHPRPTMKEGILMATAPVYSVFQHFDGEMAVDVNYFRRFPNPSRYRSTLIVAPRGNEWVNHLMKQLCYREIILN